MTQEHKEFIPRESLLTEKDIELIRDIVSCNQCSFRMEEVETLRTVAKNLNKTQKIASTIIITAMVMSILGGVVAAVKYYLIEVFFKGHS